MAKQFLDKDGLDALWTKIKTRDENIQNGVTSGSIVAKKAEQDSNGQKIADYYIPKALKGVANGVASLGSDGKVPSSQLPSYVDDVLEFASKTNFPATGEDGKIYVAEDTNKTYRWSGSSYVEISSSLALGETSSTAYAGDKGKANADAITLINSKIGVNTDFLSRTISEYINYLYDNVRDLLSDAESLQTDVNNIKTNKVDANYETSEQGNFGIRYYSISSGYCLELYGSENASGSNGGSSVRMFPNYVQINGEGEMDSSHIKVTDSSIELTAGGHSGDDTFSKVLEVTAYSLKYDDNEILDASMAIPTSYINGLS